MKILRASSVLLLLLTVSCRNMLVEKRYDHKMVRYEDLDVEVRKVVYNALLVDMEIKMITNLDSLYADFEYLKNTSNELWKGNQG